MRETWCRRPISGPIEACGASAARRSSRRGCTASRPTAQPPTSAAGTPPSAPPPPGPPPRHRHDELDESAPLADPHPDHDPQLRADAGDLRDRLRVALDDLPPRLRTVVVLRDVYDLPPQGIAAG